MRLFNGLTTMSFVALAALMAVPASAASISGSFYLSGTAVGSTSGIDFYYSTPTPPDQQGAVVLPVSGSFSNLAAGSVQTIHDITGPGVIPGTSFDLVDWVVLSNGIDLDLTSIPIPSFPVCPSTGTVANGYECIVNATSPVVLTQGSNGVSARLNVDGYAHTAGATDYVPFVGLFNAPSTNFSTVAAFEDYYDTNGGIPAIGYSANFTVSPEPETIALIAGGLLVGLGMRRKLASKKG